MPTRSVLWAFAALLGCASAHEATQSRSESLDLIDRARGRRVPVQVYRPPQRSACTRAKPCPVALLSPGYGVPHTSYSFLADALTEAGSLVIAIQHDLPSDPPLSTTGDLVTARTPIWKRGAENLRYVRRTLSQKYPAFDWPNLTLIGHSNGGDLSALALRDDPGFARTLVTLDNRRSPLPRDPRIKVLSIRGSDFKADPGVLPSPEERKASGICIAEIAGSRHDDMRDGGPAELKARIAALVVGFLQNGRCDAWLTASLYHPASRQLPAKR